VAQVCGGDVLVLLFLKRTNKRHHHHPTDVGEHLLDSSSRVLVASAALTLHEELDQHLLFDKPMLHVDILLMTLLPSEAQSQTHTPNRAWAAATHLVLVRVELVGMES
jgi:hypothetical protein